MRPIGDAPIRIVVSVLTLLALTESPAFACPVCFGAADGVMIAGARLGVLVMVGITCAVLAAFGTFFIRIARRRRNA